MGRVKGRETLRGLYPASELVFPEMEAGSRTEVRVNDDGTFGGALGGGRKVRISGEGPGLEARADLTILVPPGKTVRVHQAVGAIAAPRSAGGSAMAAG